MGPELGGQDDTSIMSSSNKGQDDLYRLENTIISTAEEQQDDPKEPEEVPDSSLSPPTTHKGVEVANVPTAHTEAAVGISPECKDDPFVGRTRVYPDSGHRGYDVTIVGGDNVGDTLLPEIRGMVMSNDILRVPVSTSTTPSVDQHSTTTTTGKPISNDPNIFACLAVQTQKTDVRNTSPTSGVMSASERAGTERCQAQTDTVVLGVNNLDTIVDTVVGTKNTTPPHTPRELPSGETDPEAGTELCQAQTEEGGGTDTTIAGDAKNPLMTSRGCQHDRRGYCATHGWGARRLERRIPCMVKGPGGKNVKSYKKKPYFECDLGPQGRGPLRQTRLSFIKTTPRPVQRGVDMTVAGNTEENDCSNFSSTTVGQAGDGTVRTEGGLEKQDEK